MISKEKVEEIKTKLFDLNGHCLTQLGIKLVDIILDNNKYELEVRDEGYDISTYPHKSDDGYDLSEYFTVEEFIQNQYTGNTKATYMSGHGIAAERYESQFQDEAYDLWMDFICDQFPEINLKDEDGYFDDDVYEELGENKIDQYALLYYFGSLDLDKCYDFYLSKTLEFRNEREIKYQIEINKRREHTKKLHSIAIDVLPFLQNFNNNKKIDAPNSKELFKFIKNLSIKYGKDKVGAALYFHEFNCSSSVQGRINTIRDDYIKIVK